MRITMLTIGSRGDVQPFVALGQGLRRAGHVVRLATHTTFQQLVSERGLDFAPIAGNPQAFLGGELGQAWQESSRNPMPLLKNRPTILEDTERGLVDCWHACQDAEAIIYTPMMLAGPHIVEKLGVPSFVATLYPGVTRTRMFPHGFAPPHPRLGGIYNWLTYAIADRVAWFLFGRTINQFRRKTLELRPFRSRSDWQHGSDHADVPFLYGYSPAVLPRAAEWSGWHYVTGYWFLERSADWTPPPALVAFLETGPPPVYVGFSSIMIRDSAALTQLVLEAVAHSGQRAILGMGWGGLRNAELPDNVFAIESIPHDWLFPRVAAVVYHGGCGTTAAALRAGIPMIVIPFCGDQFFWGQRVAQLGVGPAPIPRKRLTVDRLADAIRAATSDAGMRARAAALGERIRAEDGVARAVEAFHRHLLHSSPARSIALQAVSQQQEVTG